MRVITHLIVFFEEEEKKQIFEKVFTNVISEIKVHTMSLIVKIFEEREDKKDAYEFVTKNINLKIFEERAFDFLTRMMEKLFDKDDQEEDLLKLKSLGM